MPKSQRSLITRRGAFFSRPKLLHVSKSIFSHLPVTGKQRDRILTDGITELVNERDEEFGLVRVEQLLSQHAAQPLSRIWEFVMGRAKRHGMQQDDQSLLLLRVRE